MSKSNNHQHEQWRIYPRCILAFLPIYFLPIFMSLLCTMLYSCGTVLCTVQHAAKNGGEFKVIFWRLLDPSRQEFNFAYLTVATCRYLSLSLFSSVSFVYQSWVKEGAQSTTRGLSVLKICGGAGNAAIDPGENGYLSINRLSEMNLSKLFDVLIYNDLHHHSWYEGWISCE